MHFFSAVLQKDYSSSKVLFHDFEQMYLSSLRQNDLIPNFHVILPIVKEALLCIRKKNPPLPQTGENLRLLELVRAYLSSDPILDENTLSVFAREFCTRKPMTEGETNYLLPVLTLYVYALYCDALSGELAFAENRMRMLFTLKTFSPEKVTKLLSPVEALLRQDPSGTYQKADEATKKLYRRYLHEMARRYGCTDETMAENLLKKAEAGQTKELSFYLFHPSFVQRKRLWISIFFLYSLIFALIPVMLSAFFNCWLLCFAIPAAPILGLNFSRNSLSGRFGINRLPRLEGDQVPDGVQTLVVTTTLLLDRKHNTQLLQQLEENYLRNRRVGVHFGILADAKESRDKRIPQEELRFMMQKIKALGEKYGENFFFFWRDMQYHESEKRYFGWERKRGAILQLCAFLSEDIQRSCNFHCLVGKTQKLEKIKYILTLDADTEIPIDGVVSLVATAEFPSNVPALDRQGHIVRGYGVFQPNMVTSVHSGMATPFAKMKNGFSGSRIYHEGVSSFVTDMTGEGVFCGKGLLNVDLVYRNLRDAFPENRILSHDYLEGIQLHCGAVGHVDFMEGFPSSSLSYYQRLERWTRGDVQSLPFLFHGNCAFFAFLVSAQLWQTFLPCYAVLLIIVLSFLLSFQLLILFFALLLSFLWLEPLLRLCHMVCHKAFGRKLFDCVMTPLIREICSFLFELITLPYAGYVGGKAICKALVRMNLTHRKMLEWTTASEADRKMQKDQLLYFYRKMWIVLPVSIPVLFSGNVFGLFLSVMWLLSPIVHWRYSRQERQVQFSDVLSQQERENLIEEAQGIWHYFSAVVGEKTNWIPPDNLQIDPVSRVAFLTSPTNVGMYLLALICAKECHFIDDREFAVRLSHTVDSMEALENYRGHLYNWFSTIDLKVLGEPYVSFVDSGNLVCSLVCMTEYLQEKQILHPLCQRLQTFMERMDFSFFYREQYGLFSIGYLPQKGTYTENEFDLYMSESRSGSYYAIAKGQVPSCHWEHLSRVITVEQKHFGMLSWSGTAFEYFMPEIFLEKEEGSFLSESLRFAASVQMNDRSVGNHPIWGISESAYYAFDGEQNYQYHAFGTPALGIERGLEKKRVFSPYSTFLIMQSQPGFLTPCFANLEALKQHGGRGAYCYFDAVDATAKKGGQPFSVVQNFMSHHEGMSIASIGNILFNGLFRRLFFRNAEMRAAKYLLEEQIPYFEAKYETK